MAENFPKSMKEQTTGSSENPKQNEHKTKIKMETIWKAERKTK